MKIVINRSEGFFELSHKATMLLAEKKGIKLYPVVYWGGKYINFDSNGYNYGADVYLKHPYNEHDNIDDEDVCFDQRSYNRNDPDLVAVVEELGELACGWGAELKIVEIPDDVDWEISLDDIEKGGWEFVQEKRREWR